MDIKRAFVILLERWWIVAVTLVIGIGAAIVATLVTPPQYTSNTQLFVSTTGGTSSTESYQGDQFSQQRATSYAQILTSEILGQRVSDALGLSLSGSAVAGRVTATVVPKTVLLDVSVTDSSADRAAEIANTLSDEFISYIVPLETPTGQDQARATVTIVNGAEPATRPTTPKLTTYLIYGAACGILIGLLLVIVVATLDRRVSKRSDAESLTGLPVLGPVTSVMQSPEGRRTQLDNWTSPEAEAFRKIRVHVQSIPTGPQVILVTSSSAKESTINFSVDLAVALAESDRRTVVIETDSAHPTVAEQLSLPDSAGLVEALADTADRPDAADQLAAPTTNRNLDAIAVGVGVDATPMLSTAAMRELVEKLRQSYSYLVIDAPPAAASGATAVLSGLCDGTLLVIDTRLARDRDVATAVRELQGSDARPIAAVLTNSRRKR
ncbi:Lipopolysaccharide biosynthesis protein [Rhodococcus sp. AW25M09]|uniref:polysaccharide biosynthesis tyrosine autokinase n=1 Tax=Rhodococcus sp. AW25M09 TaxID=1268303 RepID=UPI0002ABCC44|nr:polysaccharide biosynthesis tyrosine autokinase [Rhodococcus sp. AW25M09]CCQ13665.1 Lipopolysaccharide biosynthesis protein [Rhodococcus sp. AW25M09]